MKIAVEKARKIKEAITILSQIVDEGTFRINQAGIRVCELDPSRVSMINFVWPKSMFSLFQTDNTSVTVNISELQKILNRAGNDDTLEMTVIPEKRALFQITIVGSVQRSFTIPILDSPESNETGVPKVHWSASARLPLARLETVLGDASLASDHVRIEIKSETMLLHAGAGDIGTDTTIHKGADAEFSAKEEKNYSLFSLSYLTAVVKAAIPFAGVATLEWAAEMPLKLTFPQENPDFVFEFYLAPRIETNES